MPLPVYYNPDAKNLRKPVEKRKLTQTRNEIARRFGGAELQVFRRGQEPEGAWWHLGFLWKDVLAYVMADVPDTEESRKWVREYARSRLLKRFRQEAIYWKYLVVERELARSVESVSKEDDED